MQEALSPSGWRQPQAMIDEMTALESTQTRTFVPPPGKSIVGYRILSKWVPMTLYYAK